MILIYGHCIFFNGKGPNNFRITTQLLHHPVQELFFKTAIIRTKHQPMAGSGIKVRHRLWISANRGYHNYCSL